MDSFFKLEQSAVRRTSAKDKADVLRQLADGFASSYGLDAEAVLELLEEREKLGSTGFGRGFAIPHNRITGISHPVAQFLRLDAPVDFKAADGMPVGIVFGLLSPESGGAAHLHALAAISRLMRDGAMTARLQAAPDEDALFALLSNVIDRDAA